MGVGTSVHIWLPQSSTAAAANAGPAPNPATPTERLAVPTRVLLADDHAGVRDTTAALLEELGASVVAVESGDAMLREFEARPGA